MSFVFLLTGMEVWGGENLELSFKAWLCLPDDAEDDDAEKEEKNRIEILPCSRVGHVFRSWSPYNTRGADIQRNNVRVAQVWMDEFKYIYFDRSVSQKRQVTTGHVDFLRL